MAHWRDKLVPLHATNENDLQQERVMVLLLNRRRLLAIVG